MFIHVGGFKIINCPAAFNFTSPLRQKACPDKMAKMHPHELNHLKNVHFYVWSQSTGVVVLKEICSIIALYRNMRHHLRK